MLPGRRPCRRFGRLGFKRVAKEGEASEGSLGRHSPAEGNDEDGRNRRRGGARRRSSRLQAVAALRWTSSDGLGLVGRGSASRTSCRRRPALEGDGQQQRSVAALGFGDGGAQSFGGAQRMQGGERDAGAVRAARLRRFIGAGALHSLARTPRSPRRRRRRCRVRHGHGGRSAVPVGPR